MIVVFENLENRQLLAADLVDGVLFVNGTANADIYRFDVTALAATTAKVVVTTKTANKSFVGVTQINAYTKGGPDIVKVFNGNIPVDIYSGNGDDIIRTYNTDTFVSAGAGNDIVSVSVSNPSAATLPRTVRGDSGNDYIVGSAANDGLVGGAGDDIIVGGAGNDSINGGPGRNILKGGTGDDTFHVNPSNGLFEGDTVNVGGQDTIYGGPGTDKVIRYWNSVFSDSPIWENVNTSVELNSTFDFGA